jgi:hypothetical protein
MTIQELTSRVLKAHESIEALVSGVEMGVADTRFKLSLQDHRKLRELLLDLSVMITRAERNSVAIPCDVRLIGAKTHAEIARSIKTKN